MSIIRLNWVRGEFYAPTDEGEWKDVDFSESELVGRMEGIQEPTLVEKDSRLERFFNAKLDKVAASLGDDAPVLLMTHGFNFDPQHGLTRDPRNTDNPHGRIFHFKEAPEPEEREHHTTSWPLHLGFQQEDEGVQGLAIAFGWLSSASITGSLFQDYKNHYSKAYDYATAAAWGLVNILHVLHRTPRLEGRTVNIITHSLGSRVIVQALRQLAEHAEISHLLKLVNRTVIMGGAEYVENASKLYLWLQHAERSNYMNANEGPRIYNIVGREDDVLDNLAETFGPPVRGDHNVIGHNGLHSRYKAERWMDIQIDSPKVQDWFKNVHDMEISGDRPDMWLNHWHYYTVRGNFGLYGKVLRNDAAWSMEELRKQGVPDGIAGMSPEVD